MFLHLCVSLFTGEGLPNPPPVGRSEGFDRPTLDADPQADTLLLDADSPRQTHLDADPPPPPPGYVNKRAVRILLECILVL